MGTPEKQKRHLEESTVWRGGHFRMQAWPEVLKTAESGAWVSLGGMLVMV